MPERIQLRRTKGWRMPENTVKVTRPSSDYGNPFRIGGWFIVGQGHWAWCETTIPGESGFTLIEDAATAVQFFERLIANRSAAWHAKMRADLRGKNLACWCPLGQACHADVLLRLANAPL